MKAITFLGAGAAFETEYIMPDGLSHVAPYFGVALARVMPGMDLRVFVTEGARDMHLETFTKLVEDYTNSVVPVSIPDGRNQDEMWKIFQAVVDHVFDCEEVVFDITHGFRSLPFLAFLAAAYLREVKDAKLKAVYYGNYEARDKTVTPNRAPVFDLSEFVQMLDWIVAADRFEKTGDSADLAAIMGRAQPDQSASVDQKKAWHASRIEHTIEGLTQLSLALRLLRPYEAMTQSALLKKNLEAAAASFSHYAVPFAPLAGRVAAAYQRIGLSDPRADPLVTLAHERELVDWYLGRRQYVQAIATAREWLITWTMLRAGFTDVLDYRTRELVGRGITALNGTHKDRAPEDSVPDLTQVQQIALVVQTYGELGAIRNDILHAGKSKNAQKADKLKRRIEEQCALLRSFPVRQDATDGVDDTPNPRSRL